LPDNKKGIDVTVMKSAIRVVALDLDGTLAGAGYVVSARSAATLEALQRKGVTPIIVTGRTETASIALSKLSHLTAPVVSCNGSVVTDPCSGARLLLSTLDPETVNRIMAFAADNCLEMVLWSADDMFAARPTEATSLLGAINQHDVVITPLDTVPRNNLVKIMLGGSREHLDSLQNQLAISLPLVKRSLDVFYETSNPGATKWEALSFVLDRLGFAPEECMGIADGDTDVGWLTKIGMPVAVENARPAVQAIASLRIGHHAEDSVAKFLESYFELPGR
jgi:Cof subfamily protein (haloacid dehalogenase superfamily)